MSGYAELRNRVNRVQPPVLAPGQEQVPNPSFVGNPQMALGILDMLSTAFGLQYLGPVSTTNAQATKWFNAVNGKSGTDVASPLILAAVLDNLVELRALGEVQVALLSEIRAAVNEQNGRYLM